MAAARKIIDAGFDLEADGRNLIVSPADRLTDEQCRYIKAHKAEILTELATIHDLDRHATEKKAAIQYWRFIHNGVEVDFASGATLAEACALLGCTSDDILEPIIEHESNDVPAQSASPMPGWQETTIRMWLRYIDESDPKIIAETINRCHVDIDAREFFLDRAREALGGIEPVMCSECRHYEPDPIGHGGIGSWLVGAWTPKRGDRPLYQNANRICDDFKQIEVKK